MLIPLVFPTAEWIKVFWIGFDIVFLILSLFVHKAIMWLVPVAITLIMAFNALLNHWEFIFFVPMIAILIISIMGFVHEKNNW